MKERRTYKTDTKTPFRKEIRVEQVLMSEIKKYADETNRSANLVIHDALVIGFSIMQKNDETIGKVA